MHEMSLALEILDLVERASRLNGATRVKDIFIEVGTLAGVMIPSLEFGLEIAKRQTKAQDAEIHIDQIEGQGSCLSCEGLFRMEGPIELCPHCEDSYLRIVAGDELRVREIEIEEET